MTTRRNFLRGAALVAAGLIAGDQLDIVERLTHTRRSFPAWPAMPTLHGDGVHDDADALQAFVEGRAFWDKRTGAVNRSKHLTRGTHAIGRPIDLSFINRDAPGRAITLSEFIPIIASATVLVLGSQGVPLDPPRFRQVWPKVS